MTGAFQLLLSLTERATSAPSALPSIFCPHTKMTQRGGQVTFRILASSSDLTHPMKEGARPNGSNTDHS